MHAKRLVFNGPFDVGIQEVDLPPLQERSISVRSRYCGISAGTERLAYTGTLPAGLILDEHIPELASAAAYPFPYGYALVGVVEAEGSLGDGSLLGERVLVLHPHQDRIVVDRSRAIALGAGLDPALATLIPNAETAANLILDGAPLLAERVGVLGLGTVGRIALDFLADFPLETLDAADPSPHRRRLAEAAIGGRRPVRVAEELPGSGYDLLFELSGNPAALDSAVAAAAYDARIVVGSWYGTKPARLDLGSGFHRKRLRICSSQVSTIAPALRGRWDTERRSGIAVDWCRRRSADAWVSHRVPFSSCAEAYRLLVAEDAACSHIVLDMEA